MDLFDHAASAGRDFPLEQGIPVASDRKATRNKQYPRPDFPFSRMEIGDSFTCRPQQCGDAPLIVVQNIVSGAAATYRRQNPIPQVQFTTRQVEGAFVRCWRTQ